MDPFRKGLPAAAHQNEEVFPFLLMHKPHNSKIEKNFELRVEGNHATQQKHASQAITPRWQFYK